MSEHHTTIWDICRTYWPILACSFLVSLFATPLCRRYALRKKIVDRPDDFLKPHKKSVPYLGGVAISYVLAGFLVVMGCVSIALRTRYIVLLYLLVIAGVMGLVAKSKMVRLESPRQSTDAPDPCEP